MWRMKLKGGKRPRKDYKRIIRGGSDITPTLVISRRELSRYQL